MEEILHQLRLVVYPIIYRVLAPSQVVSRISSINSSWWLNQPHWKYMLVKVDHFPRYLPGWKLKKNEVSPPRCHHLHHCFGRPTYPGPASFSNGKSQHLVWKKTRRVLVEGEGLFQVLLYTGKSNDNLLLRLGKSDVNWRWFYLLDLPS